MVAWKASNLKLSWSYLKSLGSCLNKRREITVIAESLPGILVGIFRRAVVLCSQTHHSLAPYTLAIENGHRAGKRSHVAWQIINLC